MGFIRGGLLLIVTSLLLISLLLGGLFLTLSLSLKYNNFQDEIVSSFTEASGYDLNITKEVESNFEELEERCQNNTEISLSQEEYDIKIPCEVVDQGPEAVIEEGIKDIVENSINKAYPENSGIGGFVKKLLFSDDASNSWKRFYYISLLVSIILIVLMFFLVENKFNLPLSIGPLLIVSVLPLLVLNFSLPYLENSLLSPITILFSESYTVFLAYIILGIVLIVLGFGLKVLKFGYGISKKLSKKPEDIKTEKSFWENIKEKLSLGKNVKKGSVEN